MQHKYKLFFFAFIFVMLAAVSGCRDHRAALFLWPDLDDPYIEVVQRWTRSQALHSGIETRAVVHATFKSREWREAYLLQRADLFALSPDEQTAKAGRVQDLQLQGTEIFLSIFTPQPEYSRLRFNDPLWSIFIDDRGEKVYPVEVRPVRLPLAKLQAFYPYVERWYLNYNLIFPPVESESVLLVMTGPLGRIDLQW